MLEAITLGDIGAAVAFVAAFAGGAVYLKNALKDIIANVVKSEIEPLGKQVDEMQRKIDRVDMEACKNFLVRSIADFERDKGISETELERFYEQYQHYINVGGNSYIEHKVEQLQKDGKL